jgi:hypothetical protein
VRQFKTGRLVPPRKNYTRWQVKVANNFTIAGACYEGIARLLTAARER